MTKEKIPMLVDLSDTNRPTNLADRFSELYDNEWTQALEDLNTVRREDEVGNVNLLADILEVSIRRLILNLAIQSIHKFWIII